MRNTQRPEYRVWASMKSRCNNPNDCNFAHYGARGIRVCGRWEKFENFFEDLGDRPSTTHSIHRINNDGNYEPSNVRWATKLEQEFNKTTSRLVTIGDITKHISQWADEFGIDRSTFRYRVNQGFSPDRLFSKSKLWKVKG